MPYWRLFYHLFWATKGRAPLITSDAIERTLFAGMRDKAAELGAIVHAAGCADDHVHLAVSVPPSVGLATFAGQVKGASSHLLDQTLPLPQRFARQAEYGAVSFGGNICPGWWNTWRTNANTMPSAIPTPRWSGSRRQPRRLRSREWPESGRGRGDSIDKAKHVAA